MKIKKIISLILSVIILFVLILFLVELFLKKKYGLGNPILYKANPKYGYDVIPNQIKKRFNNSIIKINEIGSRTNINNIEGNFTINFYGDSIVYGGSYIDNKELFTEKVCINYAAKNNSKINCNNFGINAYGYNNIKNKIKHKGTKDITILYLNGSGLIRNYSNLSSQPFFSDNLNSYFPAIEEVMLYYVYKTNLKRRYSSPFNLSSQFFKEENFNFETRKFYNQQINDLINSLNNKKIIFLHSSLKRSQNGVGDNFEEYVKKFLIQNDITFIDIRKKLIENSTDINKIYHDGTHFNKHGHQIISEIITNELNF